MALRRCYPQIYASDEKLLVDPGAVAVQARDFEAALRAITPASARSAGSAARLVLSPTLRHLSVDRLCISVPAAATWPGRKLPLKTGTGRTPVHLHVCKSPARRQAPLKSNPIWVCRLLSPLVAPLLKPQLAAVLGALCASFPPAAAAMAPASTGQGADSDEELAGAALHAEHTV